MSPQVALSVIQFLPYTTYDDVRGLLDVDLNYLLIDETMMKSDGGGAEGWEASLFASAEPHLGFVNTYFFLLL